MAFAEWSTFIRQAKDEFMTTGAIGPSGPFLADALCRELRRKDRGPWKILEAGPGTGAVTRRLVRYLRPGDSLTAVEINPSLAEFLRKSFRDNPLMADKASQVEVVETDLLKFPGEAIFDSAVCGLPFNNFPLPLTQDLMGAIERLLKPGSLLSYFEYYGIRRLRMALGRKGEKLNKLTEMDDYLVGRERQLGETSEMVWWNLLPAMCRRLRMPAND
jgi:phospholipid N-methyltransferase